MNRFSRLFFAAFIAASFGPAVAPARAQTASSFDKSSGGSGQAFPEKPIRIIVPWATGGSTDAIARVLAARVAQTIGQQVIVDNKPGAGGAIGAEQGARAAADGYTLTIVELTHAGSQALLEKVPYDLNTDFVPLAHLGSAPLVLFANAQLKANNLRELIALSRVNIPIPFAIIGTGSVSHLIAESIQMTEKARFNFVPYKGGAPALIDLAAGEVQVFFATLATGAGTLKTGRVKAIAVTSTQRLAALPDIPTAVEGGFKDVVVEQWWGLVAPAKTPAPIAEKLKAEFAAALAHPSSRERMGALAIEPANMTPDQLGAFMSREIRRWNKVAKDANIKIEQ